MDTGPLLATEEQPLSRRVLFWGPALPSWVGDGVTAEVWAGQERWALQNPPSRPPVVPLILGWSRPRREHLGQALLPPGAGPALGLPLGERDSRAVSVAASGALGSRTVLPSPHSVRALCPQTGSSPQPLWRAGCTGCSQTSQLAASPHRGPPTRLWLQREALDGLPGPPPRNTSQSGLWTTVSKQCE